MTRRHMREVLAKIAELRRLEAALRELSRNCRSGNPDCPMLDRLRGG